MSYSMNPQSFPVPKCSAALGEGKAYRSCEPLGYGVDGDNEEGITFVGIAEDAFEVVAKFGTGG